MLLKICYNLIGTETHFVLFGNTFTQNNENSQPQLLGNQEVSSKHGFIQGFSCSITSYGRVSELMDKVIYNGTVFKTSTDFAQIKLIQVRDQTTCKDTNYCLEIIPSYKHIGDMP